MRKFVVPIISTSCASAQDPMLATAPSLPMASLDQTMGEFNVVWETFHPDQIAPGSDARVLCTWGWSDTHDRFLGDFMKNTEGLTDENGDPWTVLIIMNIFAEHSQSVTQFIERFGMDRVFTTKADAGGNTCDFVFNDGKSGSVFNVNKMLPLLPEPPKEFLYLFTSSNCAMQDEEGFRYTPECNMMNVQYSDSNLMRGGGRCHGDVCISKQTKEHLLDPVEPLWRCDQYKEDFFNASLAETAEFGQDYFIYRNFFRDYAPQGRNGKGVYVDIGAHMPFEYSNTAFFEKCLGWDGVCVEPNPDAIPFFSSYRNCRFLNNCIFNQSAEDHWFSRSQSEYDSGIGFKADCITLNELLHSQNLGRPEVVDFLTIDVELKKTTRSNAPIVLFFV